MQSKLIDKCCEYVLLWLAACCFSSFSLCYFTYFWTYIHSTTNQFKVLLDIFHMLQKMIAQHFLTEMIIFHQFWWTNSYFFLCPPVWVEHKWLHLQHTGCECCTASVSRAVMGQMTAIVCCNLSWRIDCNLVQFGFTLLIFHCTVPLSPVDMCVLVVMWAPCICTVSLASCVNCCFWECFCWLAKL